VFVVDQEFQNFGGISVTVNFGDSLLNSSPVRARPVKRARGMGAKSVFLEVAAA